MEDTKYVMLVFCRDIDVFKNKPHFNKMDREYIENGVLHYVFEYDGTEENDEYIAERLHTMVVAGVILHTFVRPDSQALFNAMMRIRQDIGEVI